MTICPTGILPPPLASSQSPVTSLYSSQRYLVSGNENGTICIWDCLYHTIITQLQLDHGMDEKHLGSILSVHLDASSQWLFVHCRMGVVEIFQFDGSSLSAIDKKYPAERFSLCPAAFSDDLWAVPHSEREISFYKRSQNDFISFNEYQKISLDNNHGTILKIVLSSDNGTLGACLEDGNVLLLRNFDSCSLHKTFIKISSDPVTCLDFNIDKSYFICGTSSDKLFKVKHYDNEAIRKIATIPFNTSTPGVSNVRISKDHGIMICSCWDGGLRVYRCYNMKILGCLSDRREKCSPLVFLPSRNDRNPIFAVGLSDGSIVVWSPFG